MSTSVAIQGIAGSFHDQAAHVLLPHTNLQLQEYTSFNDVFAAVEGGKAHYGVCAIENSLYGSINPTYRLFEQHTLWIAAETTLHIRQYLIGVAQQKVSSLNRPDVVVMSQAPALAQCESWLSTHLPQAQRRETVDTAQSVKDVVVAGVPNHLAIAGRRAAEIYGGNILAGPINDDPRNYTRFVLLQKDRVEAQHASRTSIILKTDHTPGALAKVLQAFDEEGVNLSKLDSHPIPGDTRHYAFYLDFDVAASSLQAAVILTRLSDLGYDVKVLGSYPGYRHTTVAK